MNQPSDLVATLYLGHHRSGNNNARTQSRSLKRSQKEPSARSVRRAKKAREEEVLNNSAHRAPPGHLVGEEHEIADEPFEDHVFDEEHIGLFEQLNQEADEREIPEDAFLQGAVLGSNLLLHPVVTGYCGGSLLTTHNKVTCYPAVVTSYLCAGARVRVSAVTSYKQCSNRLLMLHVYLEDME